MKREKYRIVERHNKFYVEELTRILFWEVYITIYDDTNLSLEEIGYKMIDGDLPLMTFNTYNDAVKYIEYCDPKYHTITQCN